MSKNNDAIRSYLERLLLTNSDIKKHQETSFEQFIQDPQTVQRVNLVQENQKQLMLDFKIKMTIADVLNARPILPNGMVEKPYGAQLSFDIGNDMIQFSAMEGLEETGLQYAANGFRLEGTPLISGDLKLKFKFLVLGEDPETTPHEKPIVLIINNDPKKLWKDIPSDPAQPFSKPDSESLQTKLGDRMLVAASKRGRSHANVGSFRDDHMAFSHIESSQWNLVTVADGAGSAKYSRFGSKLACEAVVDYFNLHLAKEKTTVFEEAVMQYQQGKAEDSLAFINQFIYEHLSKAAISAYQSIEKEANSLRTEVKDFHTTLIFCLFKRFDFGYVTISFGVGDCPIAVVNKDKTEVNLLNWLDVGDFGGGTRFITMPEVFRSDKFATRFKFKIVEDFSYLFLMTDGIYDPKFQVEANLEKIACWNAFIDDLQGENADHCAIDFNSKNEQMASQLLQWMDFWSPGNHDDRTLAIVL